MPCCLNIQRIHQHISHLRCTGLYHRIWSDMLTGKLYGIACIGRMWRKLSVPGNRSQDHQIIYGSVSISVNVLCKLRTLCVQLLTDLTDQSCLSSGSFIGIYTLIHRQIYNMSIFRCLWENRLHSMLSSRHIT